MRDRVGRRLRLGLRTVGPAFAIANAALTLATIGALALGVWYVQRKSAVAEVSTRRMMAAHELHLDLLEYHRASDLLLDEDDPAAARERALRHRALRRRLDSVEPLAAEAVKAYLQERRRAEARHLPLAQVLRRTRQSLELALSELRRVELASSRQHDAVEGGVLQLVRTMEASAILVALLLAAAWAAFLAGLRRHVTQPILALHAVAERIRRGEGGRAVERGARETAELAQAFNAMTDALDQQREDQRAFVAGFVHELKNPLAGVRAAAQAIGEEPDPAVRAHALTMMLEEMDRIGRLTGDVLDTLRVEAGHVELRPAEVDLSALGAEIAREHASRAPRHALELRARAPVLARVDPLRVRQLLHNLVDNAVKYSPDGGRVVISVEERDGAAELRVTDHGIGLAPADLADIFSPFRRRAAGVAAGTGLGLSIVKRIVDAHGGTVRVDSALGAGSTFCVSLPLAPPEAGVAAPSGSPG